MRAATPSIGALIVLLAGCISEPDPVEGADPEIISGESPSADFSSYRTYAYAPSGRITPMERAPW